MLEQTPQNDKNKGRSSALDRRVQAYLRPQVFTLVQAYAKDNNMSESKVIDVIAYQFFGEMPQDMKAQLIQRFRDAD